MDPPPSTTAILMKLDALAVAVAVMARDVAYIKRASQEHRKQQIEQEKQTDSVGWYGWWHT
eukprot:COSAG01_NODE_228_length_21104_cov_210.303832_29_plen_61_part_00